MPARKTPTTSTSRPRSPKAAAAKAPPPKAKAAAAAKRVAKPAAKPAAKAPPAAKPKAAPAAKPAKLAPPRLAPVVKAAPIAKPASAPKSARAPKPVPVERVTSKDHKLFETRLLEERGRLLKELGYLEANVLNQNPRDSSGDLSGYSFHMADAGTDAMEREKAFLFASAEGRALHDVDAALRRLYSDEYGLCESCNQPIAPQRLEVVPYARLCIKCKEREEKTGRR